jgi:hypothetical protein
MFSLLETRHDTCRDLPQFPVRNEQRADEYHEPGRRTLLYLKNSDQPAPKDAT